MSTIACCLVVWLGLGLAYLTVRIRFSVWLVICYWLYFRFSLPPCRTSGWKSLPTTEIVVYEHSHKYNLSIFAISVSAYRPRQSYINIIITF